MQSNPAPPDGRGGVGERPQVSALVTPSRPRASGADEYCLRQDANLTTEEIVRALLDRLPDDCMLDDVQYHLSVAQAVARGSADEREGRTITHAEVEAEMRHKWVIASGP